MLCVPRARTHSARATHTPLEPALGPERPAGPGRLRQPPTAMRRRVPLAWSARALCRLHLCTSCAYGCLRRALAGMRAACHVGSALAPAGAARAFTRLRVRRVSLRASWFAAMRLRVLLAMSAPALRRRVPRRHRARGGYRCVRPTGGSTEAQSSPARKRSPCRTSRTPVLTTCGRSCSRRKANASVLCGWSSLQVSPTPSTTTGLPGTWAGIVSDAMPKTFRRSPERRDSEEEGTRRLLPGPRHRRASSRTMLRVCKLRVARSQPRSSSTDKRAPGPTLSAAIVVTRVMKGPARAGETAEAPLVHRRRPTVPARV